jgi:hypothetical protein
MSSISTTGWPSVNNFRSRTNEFVRKPPSFRAASISGVDSALQCRQAAKALQREPLIGHQGSVRCQRLLTVTTALHGSEEILEVAADPPEVRAGVLGQAHRLEHQQSFCHVLFLELRIAFALTRVQSNREKWRSAIRRLRSIALDSAVE